MPQQTINVGAAPNDGTGDKLRDAYIKINANFDEVYPLLPTANEKAALPGPLDHAPAIANPYVTVSYLNAFNTSSHYWKVTGDTTLTNPVLIGNPFFQGNILIGPTGATITAGTRVDIRGTGSGNNILRLADNTNAERVVMKEDGSIATKLATIKPIAAFSIGTNDAYNATFGVYKSIYLTNAIQPSSGGMEYNAIDIANTIETSGSYLGTMRGFYYHPTVNGVVGLTHIAFENTAGQIRLGAVPEDTSRAKFKILAIDETTNQVFWRSDSSIFNGEYWTSNGSGILGPNGTEMSASFDAHSIGLSYQADGGIRNTYANSTSQIDNSLNVNSSGASLRSVVAGVTNELKVNASGSIFTGKVGGAFTQDNTLTKVMVADTNGFLYWRASSTFGVSPAGEVNELQVNNGSGGFGACKVYGIGNTVGVTLTMGSTSLTGGNRTIKAESSGSSANLQLITKGNADVFIGSIASDYIALNANHATYGRNTIIGTKGFLLGTASGFDISFGVQGNNITFFSAGDNMQGGNGVLFIRNASAIPTGNPSLGGFLYTEGGALKYRGSSGTITTVGAA